MKDIDSFCFMPQLFCDICNAKLPYLRFRLPPGVFPICRQRRQKVASNQRASDERHFDRDEIQPQFASIHLRAVIRKLFVGFEISNHWLLQVWQSRIAMKTF